MLACAEEATQTGQRLCCAQQRSPCSQWFAPCLCPSSLGGAVELFGPSLDSDWKYFFWMAIRIRVSLGKSNQKMQISAAAGGKNGGNLKTQL